MTAQPLTPAARTLTAERLAAELTASRERSLSLLAPLDEQDLTRQISPLMSPLVWDLAHIGNYEELWLLREVAGVDPIRPEIDSLYDAFEHPRSERPTLPILGPGEALAYLSGVRHHVLDVLDRTDLTARELTRDGFVFAMVVQHEHMHDETMLATLQLRGGPRLLADGAALPSGRPVTPHDDVLVPGGWSVTGTSTDPWALDNERPAHRVELASFGIDRFPVTNTSYAAFVDSGGYDDQRLWTEPGWAHLQASGRRAPMTWRRDGAGGWVCTRFGRDEAVDPAAPVEHVCWFEADAYARWVGRRLPTEQEWEKACGWDPVAERLRRYPWGDGEPTPELANLGQRATRPAPVGAYPAGASAYGVEQLVGGVWEWTSSGFQAYPGTRAFPYAEYSEVFYGGDFRVLRGGSWATDASAVRTTFRNWDLPVRRQIFSGFRTARV
ncbi:MAG: ergothioneine biosynthesis protein EgtB [Frankiales bacterium]|nr:ergothioneine biosynthesis protein EgtB [Frankiales bacterium]